MRGLTDVAYAVLPLLALTGLLQTLVWLMDTYPAFARLLLPLLGY